MTLFAIPANPTRGELRAALASLKGLAALGIPGAQSQLDDLSGMMNDLFPRGTKSADGPSRTRRARRRRIIQPEDAPFQCPCCKGRKVVDWFLPIIGNSYCTFKPMPQQASGMQMPISLRSGCWRVMRTANRFRNAVPGLLNPKARSYRLIDMTWVSRIDSTCPECRGTGVKLGTPAHLIYEATGGIFTQDALPSVKRGKKVKGGAFIVRGDYATSAPLRPVPKARYRHKRGYACGRLIGNQAANEAAVRRQWAFARGLAREQGLGTVAYPTPADVSAHLEHIAKRQMKQDGPTPKPRNRKKMGSQRDKRNLTADQERRSKMAKRTRQNQAAYDHTERWGATVLTKRIGATNPPTPRIRLAGRAQLKAMGIDVAAIERELNAKAEVVKVEKSQHETNLAVAKRRGDLEPTHDYAVRNVFGKLCAMEPAFEILPDGRRKYALDRLPTNAVLV